MTSQDVQSSLRALATPKKAEASARFFKTGPGQYGEGDVFVGVTVPEQRLVAKGFRDIPLIYIEKLLQSEVHEDRFTALIILVSQFQRVDESGRNAVAQFYLMHRARVNNWDLVDASASYILGPWLENEDRKVIYDLAASNALWDKRIAVLAAGYYIRNDDFTDIFALADLLMADPHDLMHKAIGWMLREVGKKDRQALEDFLKPRYSKMPRTMLRYTIEKFEPEVRRAYLGGLV